MYAPNAEEAFERYGKSVFAAAYSLCGNSYDANDVMQDVFFKLHCLGKGFKDSEHLKKWLIRCAVNASKNVLRSRKNKSVFTDDLPPESIRNENIVFEDERQHCLAEVVEKLPEKQRIAVHLYYYEDYSVKEIAAVTGQSEAGVKMCLSRGREKLKNVLGEEFYYD